jgi:hypothetical protein
MFAFITIGTNNLKKSSAFYNKILKPLKIKKVLSHNRYYGYAKKETPKKIELYLIRPHNKKKATIGNGTMINLKLILKKLLMNFIKLELVLEQKMKECLGPEMVKIIMHI